MKTTINLKLLALLGILLVSINYLSAQCTINSSFTFVDNGNGSISFTNTSSGNYNASFWDFGDGNTSTQTNPTHIYATTGAYVITLAIYDTTIAFCGDTSTFTIPVTVNTPCGNAIASFNTTDNGGGNFSFTNTSTGYTAPINYYWNFGDGNFSNAQNPNHTYTNPGIYTVSFGIYGANCSDSIWQQITVTAPCNLTSSFTFVDNGNGNFSFTNTSTGNYNFSFWDFGDGNNSLTPNPNHTYATTGTYTVQLIIGDSNYICADTSYQTIQVTSSNPCANTNSSFSVLDNGNGNYSFTNTSSGYTAPINYYWNFGDGNFSNAQNPNHTYATPGTYTVSFGIYGANCSDSIWQTITYSASNPCTANAGFNFTDNGNGNFNFTSTATGNITNYYWNFGDGNTSTQVSPSHTYTTNGTFPVQQIVFDTVNMCSDMFIHTITVTGVNNPTSCNAAFMMFPDSLNNVIVLNTSTGNNLTYFWDFGDGNTSTQQFPSHTYNTPGPFYLCLTVTSGNCSSTYCDSISNGGIVLRQTGFTINVQAHNQTGVNENINVISELNTYPNPVKDQLTIELNLIEQTNLNITITDVLGNTVDVIDNSNLSSGFNKLYWNTNNVSNGVYLLQINGENTTEVKKLIINK